MGCHTIVQFVDDLSGTTNLFRPIPEWEMNCAPPAGRSSTLTYRAALTFTDAPAGWLAEPMTDPESDND